MSRDDHTPRDGAIPESIAESTALLSKKWHPVVVSLLASEGGLGFSDIETQLGVSAKVLTDALERLQDAGVVDRTELSHHPLRVEYTLTDRGEELATLIDSLADWGERYLTSDDDRVVLVAEDDRRIATMHTTWLESEYTVRTAYDGEQALQKLDTDVDVVLLDRRMPGLSGDEVLEWVRSQGYDCRVALVTSEDPALDVLELDFDEYVTKPVLRDDLRNVVANLFERAEYDREVRQYLALRAKIGTLEAGKPRQELEASEEFRRLERRVEELEHSLDEHDDIDPTALSKSDIEAIR